MSKITAQTVLSALENLQKSYTGQKQHLETTLKSIKVNITEIDICLKNLITNFGDKADLKVKLDKTQHQYDTAKGDANVTQTELDAISKEVENLKDEMFNREGINNDLVKEIQTSINKMKTMCSINDGEQSQTMAELQADVTRKQADVTRKQENLDNAPNKGTLELKATYDKRIAKLQAELDEAQAELNEAQAALDKAPKDLVENKAQKKIAKLAREHQETKKFIEWLRDKKDNDLNSILDKVGTSLKEIGKKVSLIQDDDDVEKFVNTVMSSLNANQNLTSSEKETIKKYIIEFITTNHPVIEAKEEEKRKARAGEVKRKLMEDRQQQFESKSDEGGYKHSSRKSKSKSTRRRVKNKFKKIKIFSKKRRSNKNKKRK